MKDINKIIIPSLLLNISDDYSNDYFCDNMKVNDCIMKMYLYILTRQEEFFNEFEILYDQLLDEEKEIVKKDYKSIIGYNDEEDKDVILEKNLIKKRK